MHDSVEAAKRGLAAVTICSTAFTGLGRAQAKALGIADLPIAVVPHPFGVRTREQVRELASECVDEVAHLACFGEVSLSPAEARAEPGASRAELLAVPQDADEMNRYFLEQGWSDGLPMVPPTEERVARMLRSTKRAPDEIVSRIAPRLGAATVERIAINAVMAGCYPEYLPVLIAVSEAMAQPQFNLQGVQATTNPAAVWMILNGPLAHELRVNSGANCFGPGAWANATLGRGLRLILQNIGGGEACSMDRATHGQPGKYTFCCSENEEANPWEPLHVERGFARSESTVTVAAPLGTWNMNTHAKDVGDLLRVIGDTMAFPCSSDYVHGGSPFLVLSPEHAHILKRDGLSKAEVKRRLWDESRISAARLSAKDCERVQAARTEELGEITRDTMLPISRKPDDINIIVAGGEGTHSVYMPISGHSFSATRLITTF